MGTGQTKPQYKSGRTEHARMNNYKLVLDKYHNDRKLMEVNCFVGSHSELSNWEKQLEQITSINKVSGSSLFLPLHHNLTQEGMCGTAGTLKMLFEFYPYILSEEIESRIKLQTPFNEQELWYLLYEIVCASKDFEKLNMKSGDIRPCNIVVNEAGQIKLVNRCTFPNQSTNYSKAFESKQPGYLCNKQFNKAPEELTEIERRALSASSDPVLAESFSIGMTIMDAGLLFNSETLYDMDYIGFKAHIFNENVYKWKTSPYSPFLVKTIENMVEVNHIERPTPGEVYAILRPYEQNIRNLDPFEPHKEKSKQSLEEYQQSMRKRTLQNVQRNIKPLGSRSTSTIFNSANKQTDPLPSTPKSQTQSIKFPQMTANIAEPKLQKPTNSLYQTARVIPHSRAYLQGELSPNSPQMKQSPY